MLGLQGGAGTYPSYHRATGRAHPGHGAPWAGAPWAGAPWAGAPWAGAQSDTGLTNKDHTHIHTCGKVIMISGKLDCCETVNINTEKY